MISKRIVEEIVEITADIIGIDKSLMRRKSLRDDSGKLHQFRSVVCYILMYDLNMRSQFLYQVLNISPSQLSRHSGKVLANDEYIDQVRSYISTHGLLSPEKLKSFDFSNPENYQSVQKLKTQQDEPSKN